MDSEHIGSHFNYEVAARAVTVAYVESQRVYLGALACGMLAVGSGVRALESAGVSQLTCDGASREPGGH
jgi:hypothetical protein